MKKKLSYLILFSALVASEYSYSQSTFNQIYQILNSASCGNNFNSCHNSSGPSGLNFNQTELQVYNSLFNQNPHNNTASARKDKLVYPGHPYRSFLFRKINNGLAFNVDLENGEGVNMPQSSPALNEKQIELIRQWIIYGAPYSGNVVNANLITEFYDNTGIESVPNPPLPPNASEGFQIHFGPVFLPPGGENLSQTGIPLMVRIDMNLEDTVEFYRVENHVGTGFHHSGISMVYNTNMIENIPYGIITQDSLASLVAFSDVKLLTAFQQNDTLNLPSGTAFNIPVNAPLLYSDHFINTSPSKVLSCDVYLNIYYEPKNTALQIMNVQLWNYGTNFNNPLILLPPNNLLYEYEESIFEPGSSEKRYMWGIMCHSHVHTVYHDFYLRNTNNTNGIKIYEGACPNGLPGCSTPVFQPFEIPTRYFNNFIEIEMGKGLRRQGGFRNQTDDTIHYGGLALTNEMMGMAYYYITDTTGIGSPNSISENFKNEITVYPNPSSGEVIFNLESIENKLPVSITIYDATGKIIFNTNENKLKQFRLNSDIFPTSGIYFFRINTSSETFSGKLIHQ